MPSKLAQLDSKMVKCQNSKEIFPYINSYFFDRDVLVNDIAMSK